MLLLTLGGLVAVLVLREYGRVTAIYGLRVLWHPSGIHRMLTMTALDEYKLVHLCAWRTFPSNGN